jgi:hypothetical protein
LFSLHLAQKGHPSKFIVKYIIVIELFNVRAPAGGTARKAREAQKENQNSTQKTPQKQRNHRFFSRLRAKPPKKHVKTAKKAPPGGHNDPQERPRRTQEVPRRPQERPKSAPRAAQRRSQSSLGGHLGPTWRPRGSRSPPGSPFGPLGGGFWPLRGSQSSPAQATVTSPPPSQKPVWGRRHEAAAYEISNGIASY